MFEIGDDDDPPGYDETHPADLVARDDEVLPTDGLAGDDDRLDGRRQDGEVVEEEEMELVEIRHPVSKSDTILSIARRYAADVSLSL